MGGVLLFIAVAGVWFRAHQVPGDPRESADPDALIRGLETLRPKVVLIGDSMLFTRMKPESLSKISGQPTGFLCNRGASSAVWFLYFKNVILRLKNRPRTVVILFRDQQLSRPKMRTGGMHKAYLESLMRGPEPLASALLSRKRTLADRLRMEADAWVVKPFEQAGEAARHRMVSMAMDLSSLGDGKRQRNEAMNERFALRHLRHDLPATPVEKSAEADDTGKRIERFDPSPDVSFLPAIVEMARQNHIRLVFFRVKCRPDERNISPETPDVKRYINGLRLWLAQQDCPLFDETGDLHFSPSDYADGDHLAEERMDWYTHYFWERMAPHLQ